MSPEPEPEAAALLKLREHLIETIVYCANEIEVTFMESEKRGSISHIPGVASARLEPMSFEDYRNSRKRNQERP